jgi:hypothetical protein
MSQLIDDIEKVSVLSNLSEMSKIAYYSYTQPNASAWLTTRPLKYQGLYLEDAEFIVAIKQRLGVSLFQNSPKCSSCQKELDEDGYHALTCKKKSETTRRHNAVRNILSNQCSFAGLNPVKEKPRLVANSKMRPADIFLPKASQDCDLWIDVAVTDPRRPNMKSKSILKPGSAAEEYSKLKHHKYDHLVPKETKFVPVVVETFGAFAEEAHDIINLIVRKDAERNEIAYSIRKSLLYSKLSISLQKSNARSILEKQRMHKNYNNNNNMIKEDNQNIKSIINEDKAEAIEIKNQKNVQSSRNSINKNIFENDNPLNEQQQRNEIVNNISKSKIKKNIHKNKIYNNKIYTKSPYKCNIVDSSTKNFEKEKKIELKKPKPMKTIVKKWVLRERTNII